MDDLNYVSGSLKEILKRTFWDEWEPFMSLLWDNSEKYEP